jgi:mannose-6-phosphate isomerase class I
MEYEIYVGAGASHLCPNADVLIYIDMARREIRKRFTENSATNLASNRYMSNIFRKLKVAYFIDWRVLDRYKKTVLKKCDYIIDANQMENPKMISRQLFDESLKITVSKPFRLVPSFESGISGGQWMKKNFDLNTESKNYQTCFDCIAEENSLMFAFGDTFFEIPAMDLVFKHPEKLLGTRVFERFGDEFPIRFNIIDTMRGKNMNLEVHPTDDYMKEKFGMKYAQDESYYLLDAKDDSAVYLGLNEDVDPETMISDLGDMYSVGKFEIDKYVTRYPVVKHDHLLIPAGTVHSLGQNCVALEIATSPYIFAFKLWEANRFTFEYEMYPLNVKRGIEVIQWDRRELSVQSELINHFETLQREECLHEERTGLHDFAFIETRRHRFKKTVFHRTEGSVNVLNLVSGREVIVESPSGRFEPLIVHYAETFIIPNCVGEYTIRPYGESEGKYCITIKAFVRPETMPQS